jgi:hypothetical protein
MNTFDLYSINENCKFALQEIESNWEEHNDDIVQEYLALCETRDEAILSACSSIKALKAQEELQTSRMNELKSFRDRTRSMIDNIENGLKGIMEIGERIESEKGKVLVSKSEATKIIDGTNFAELYESFPLLIKRKIEYSPNISEIKQAIKDGADIQFAEIVQNKSLRITI